MSESPRTFDEFWPHYVRAHLHPATRVLHFTGTLSGWVLLVVALLLRNLWLIPLALMVGYAFAWVGHFFVEHNRPASFGHPGWSWLADQKMVGMMLAGKMSDEVKRITSEA